MNTLSLASIFLIISIASAQVCTSNYWNCWNQLIKSNGGQRLAPKPSTTPTKTSGILGTVSWNRVTTNLTTRSNQYTYTLQQDPKCVIKCGLQSYPTYQNGYLYCVRDPYFWTGMKDPSSIPYTSICIPVVANYVSAICSFATNNLNTYTPSCSKSALPNVYSSSNNDCCYNNLNSQNFGDQTDIKPTTNYDNIVLPAYLYNAP